ncbi:MAG: MoaD/ThiS family protein [Anaerolineae bacterium]
MAITVSVRYHNALRHRTGLALETVELAPGTNLAAMLAHLAEAHGSTLGEMLLGLDGEVAPHLVVFRNGRLIYRDQRDELLADGDELLLFPAISGG